MHTGMLWFDNSQSTLAQKIQRAVDYYTKKYGRKPDLCLVHPSFLSSGNGRPGAEKVETDLDNVNGVTVRPYRPVLPGHIWIGVEDKPSAEANKANGDD